MKILRGLTDSRKGGARCCRSPKPKIGGIERGCYGVFVYFVYMVICCMLGDLLSGKELLKAL